MVSMVFNGYLRLECFIPVKGKRNWVFKTSWRFWNFQTARLNSAEGLTLYTFMQILLKSVEVASMSLGQSGTPCYLVSAN